MCQPKAAVRHADLAAVGSSCLGTMQGTSGEIGWLLSFCVTVIGWEGGISLPPFLEPKSCSTRARSTETFLILARRSCFRGSVKWRRGVLDAKVICPVAYTALHQATIVKSLDSDDSRTW